MPVSRRNALKSGLALGASAVIGNVPTAHALTRDRTSRSSSNAAPLLTLEDYERAARERIDPVAWEYIASGAADEISLRWNMDAYRSMRLVPHQLRDVSKLDTSV